MIAWLIKGKLVQMLGKPAFDVALGGMMGALGAFMSLLTRLSSPDGIKVDAGAGRLIHVVDCVSRLLAGAAGALLVAFAVQADVFLSFTKASQHSLAILLVLCVAAGASERLVPSLIKRVETTSAGLMETQK